MAKKQVFGNDAQKKKGTHRRMAKVIISTPSSNNHYAFKEAMVEQEQVKEYIKERKA